MKLDEHEVPNFSYEKYLGTQYPTIDSLRYPKAGCANAKASVCVYDVATKGIQKIPLEGADCYIPRMKWRDENTVMVLRVNRDQTKMEVLA